MSASKIARSTIVGLALFGAACVEMSALGIDSALQAQNIINNAGLSGNNLAQSFSGTDENASVTGSFEPGKILQVKLPAANGVPVIVEAADYHFPFVFPANANTSGISAIDLLCSPDKGKTWYAYASVLANDERKEFLFQAPKEGDYWFALMTSFKSGKRSYSSTRAMTFTQGIPPQEDQDDSSFSLADDSGDDFSVPSLDAPADHDADPDSLSELSDLGAPEALPQPKDDELLVNNASYASEDAQPEPTMPTAPNLDEPELQDPQAQAPASAAPWPGKFRSLSFGVGKGSGSLMVTVRWFRPTDLEAQYDVNVQSLSIERAPSPTGPWTIVAEDLDVNENGYSWTATADEMKPFYVRSVARDAQGHVWRDVTSSPLDVNLPAVRSALGPVKTPVPFTDAAEKSDDAQEPEQEKSKSGEKTKMIRHTASEDDVETSTADQSDLEEASEKKSPTPGKLVSTVERSQAKQPAAPPRVRPDVPAPTNPNEFQVNPLFTQGFSVLYQSSQARLEPTTPGKRSIFTPPSKAQRGGYVRPAERRLSDYQIAQSRAEQQRKEYEERMKYNREHEMETFAQKPELMEGRMFYMDANGNLTTTPPAEMQQALNSGNLEAQGWTRVGDSTGAGQTTTVNMTGADGSEALYMPRDAEAYDASARSGAAIWSNNQYPQASSPGSSPLNNRYSDGPVPAQQGTTGATGGAAQSQPQASYSPSRSTSPYYISNASSATSNYAFPPRPSVTQ